MAIIETFVCFQAYFLVQVRTIHIIETCNVFKSSKQLTLFRPATGNNVDCSYLHQRICLETHKSLYNGHVHTPLGQQCGLLPCAQWQLLPSACGLGQQLLLGTGQQSTLLPSGGVNMATLGTGQQSTLLPEGGVNMAIIETCVSGHIYLYFNRSKIYHYSK